MATNGRIAVETFTSLPHEVYHDAVNEIAARHNLSDASKYEMKIFAGSAKGDNYLGAMYRVVFKSKEDASTKLSLIAKLAPPNEARRQEFQILEAFSREIDFYDVLFPLYEKFQEERGVVAEAEKFHEIPRCHLTLSEAPLEGIFLEDLRARNFEMYDRHKDCTREHANIVLKSLAKMHAVFMCVKDQKPESVKKFVGMKDFFMYWQRNEKNLLFAWYKGQKKHAMRVLESVKDSRAKEEIRKVLNMDMYALLESLLGVNVAEPYSTICHGDVWNNNMLFRNDENGAPVEVCLLDLQAYRYTSPAIDVVHYIFTTTTRELRSKHYEEFLNVYYDTLVATMSRLKSDPSKLFPRRVFDEHLVRFGKFGLYMAVLGLPAITAYDTPDIDELSEKMSQNGGDHTVDFKPSEKYHERMLGVFEDIYRFGYV